MTTAIALRPSDGLTAEQVDLVKRTICKGATDDELALFVQTANRMRLDPFARQIFAVKRYVKKENREVMSIQVSIDGFRLTAERTGHYAGQLGPLWTADGKEWVEVWLDSKKPPAAAKVAVLRHDFKEPVWAVATWDQYKQESQYGLAPMWQKMGPLMLAKCAESLALRRAFPNELSGAYTPEEMAQAEEPAYIPPKETQWTGTTSANAATPPATTTIHQTDAGTATAKPGTQASPTTTDSPTSNRSGTTSTPIVSLHDHDFDKKTGKCACGEYRNASFVPAKDGPITPEQVKLIHTLRGDYGGLTEQAYRDVVKVYRQADGTPCVGEDGKGTSKKLTAFQAAHLISRFQRKINQQKKTAANGDQRGPAPPLPPKPAANLDDELQKAFDEDEAERFWLHAHFGINHRNELEGKEAATALELLLAMQGDPMELDRITTRLREEGRIR